MIDVLLLVEMFSCEIKKRADLWTNPIRKESSLDYPESRLVMKSFIFRVELLALYS